jgi:hypothetical protein
MTNATLRPEEQAALLQRAFQWIASQRAAQPTVSLEALIDLAAFRYALSPAQVSWVRWSLAPEMVAVQSKEPDPSFH